MNTKNKVDEFLRSNFEEIETLRHLPNFRWLDIALKINIGNKQNPDSEYVRSRFSKLRRKIGDSKPSSWLEEKGWDKKESKGFEYTITSTEQSMKIPAKFQYQGSKENKQAGTKELSFIWDADNPPSEAEIIEHFKIDTTKYRIASIWDKTSFGGKLAISVNLVALKGNELIKIDQEFIDKISQK
jgi:hypothetical protein